MSTNISKQKREDLLAKIKEIRTFISSAPQDENTGNLLSYLSDLEKDVNGKKYGLVFEEHREEIDEVLDTHTPVLTEDADLFIDNGGQVNCLIEGDNYGALKVLQKTHRGKIDLIYIDPPYHLHVYNDILKFIDEHQMLKEYGYIVCESLNEEEINKEYQELVFEKEVSYGIMKVIYIRRKK